MNLLDNERKKGKKREGGNQSIEDNTIAWKENRQKEMRLPQRSLREVYFPENIYGEEAGRM